MKTYHQAVIELANTFDGFYISDVSCLQNTKADALAALAATLSLLADTCYRLTMATRQLFFPKFNLEVNKVHATSTVGDSLSLTMPCMAYCPMIPRRRLSFDEDLLPSTMIRL